jgi:hypothetical protein
MLRIKAKIYQTKAQPFGKFTSVTSSLSSMSERKDPESESDRQTKSEKPQQQILPLAMQNLSDSLCLHCKNFNTIITHQISQPESLSSYLNRVIEASKSISESPHGITPEESQVFATLYQAMFENEATNDRAAAEAHLTAAKIIAKSLG